MLLEVMDPGRALTEEADDKVIPTPLEGNVLEVYGDLGVLLLRGFGLAQEGVRPEAVDAVGAKDGDAGVDGLTLRVGDPQDHLDAVASVDDPGRLAICGEHSNLSNRGRGGLPTSRLRRRGPRSDEAPVGLLLGQP